MQGTHATLSSNNFLFNNWPVARADCRRQCVEFPWCGGGVASTPGVEPLPELCKYKKISSTYILTSVNGALRTPNASPCGRHALSPRPETFGWKLSRNFWLETFQKLLVGSFYYWLETSRNFWEVLETFQELLVGNFPDTFGWKLSRNFWLETFTIGWKSFPETFGWKLF